MEELIESALKDVGELCRWASTSREFREFALAATRLLIQCYQKHGKVLVCGNGGSAADSQHLAGELVGKYSFARPPLSAIALNTDTSILTAVGNDYGFERVFSRQVLAYGVAGDVLIALSTSGSSRNVIEACLAARTIGMSVICLTGSGGGRLKEIGDLCLMVPSSVTPRVQEVHQIAYHLICHMVEERLFGSESSCVSR